MATATKATSFDIRFPSPVGSPYASAIVVTVTATAGSTNGDSLKLCRVPRGVTVVDGLAQVGAGDTNATPTLVASLQITDGTTTKTLIHQASTAQAGGLIRPTKAAASEDAIGFTTNGDDYFLRFLWDTGAATGASVVYTAVVMTSGWYAAGAVTE